MVGFEEYVWLEWVLGVEVVKFKTPLPEVELDNTVVPVVFSNVLAVVLSPLLVLNTFMMVVFWPDVVGKGEVDVPLFIPVLPLPDTFPMVVLLKAGDVLGKGVVPVLEVLLATKLVELATKMVDVLVMGTSEVDIDPLFIIVLSPDPEFPREF